VRLVSQYLGPNQGEKTLSARTVIPTKSRTAIPDSPRKCKFQQTQYVKERGNNIKPKVSKKHSRSEIAA
jgi:hypothetical protein